MKFLSRFHIHRVENDMIVDVVGVSVSGNQCLEATEVFSEAQTDLVSRFGGDVIVRTEGLYDVNVGSAVLFLNCFLTKVNSESTVSGEQPMPEIRFSSVFSRFIT